MTAFGCIRRSEHLLPQVLVGAHTLLANGGIIAPAGTALVALAAKKHAVPLVVLVVSEWATRHRHTRCWLHAPRLQCVRHSSISAFSGNAPACAR